MHAQSKRVLLFIALIISLTVAVCGAARAPSGAPAARPARAAAIIHPPVFAYYYMWMSGNYWHVHKKDHPVQPFPGDYSSADPAVISWQIQHAQAAGIGGFLVSWKNNATYQRIVPLLENAANQHHFKLAMTYESLDARGHRLPASQVAADFHYFIAHYAANAAWYRISGRPLTVWDATDSYPASAIAGVTRTLRSRLVVLNSASTVAGITRLAPYTDGDAYYWSSIDPARDPAWGLRLAQMGAAVHRTHGIWIAPFAPGFDARLIGGHIVVGRAGGLTLRLEYKAALASSPDILGLISWNEWTENTYLEPSVKYGFSYPDLLRSLL